MQYIQLQSQIAEGLDLPLQGSFNLFIDTADNSIKAKDFEGNLTGGGLSLVEVTSEDVHQMAASASLTPGAFYKITGAASRSFLEANGFGYNSWQDGGGNEIQYGGTTIILQATSEKTLAKKGIGLFYVPNYEDPNNPTLPPDTNYKTWDNTHRFNVTNVNGRFLMGEYVQLYSNETDATTYAYLEGSLYNSGSNGSLTLRLENGDDHFLDNSDNLIGLVITGQDNGAQCDYDSTDYINHYNIGDCVIYGGTVHRNISGNIGAKYGGWPSSDVYLTGVDWEIVPFDEVHYTLEAHQIEYEFEYDNISYRNDGVNEVFSNWKWWDNNWGYNIIKFFPWGHKNINRISISNSYLASFVNFPYDAEAWNIKFEDGGGFNAHTWGKGSGFYDIYGEKGAHFVGNNFGNGTDIYSIKLGIYSYMSGISTCDNGYQDNSQIYEVTLANNANFQNFSMYYGSYIQYVEIGTEADLRDFTMFEYSAIRNVILDINSYFGYFTLYNNSEIKYVNLGINSYIQNGDLYYSSCLKRTTLGTDSYIQNFSIGINSFFRQINLSERAYLYDVNIGEQSNLQNIDLGAYSYLYNVDCGYSSNIENIRLDARANMNNIHMGYASDFSEIEIAPNSSIYNIYNADFSSSYISGISIKPHSNLNTIYLGSNAFVENIQLGNNAYFGATTLEEGTHLSNLIWLGSSESGEITLQSGSYIENFQIGIDAGFGSMDLATTVTLTNFEINEDFGFGGQTFTSSLDNITIGRGFSNFYNTYPQNSSHGVGANGHPAIWIDNRSIITIDVSGQSSTYDFDLPDGNYEGQELTFVVKSDGTHTLGPDQISIWTNKLVVTGYGYGFQKVNGGGTYLAFRPFAKLDSSNVASLWRNATKAIWTGGIWVTDAEVYND